MDDHNKILTVVVALVILVSGISVIAAHMHSDYDDGVTIGVTWRPNSSAESYVNTIRSIETAGGTSPCGLLVRPPPIA